jgi:hypothetical protein
MIKIKKRKEKERGCVGECDQIVCVGCLSHGHHAVGAKP